MEELIKSAPGTPLVFIFYFIAILSIHLWFSVTTIMLE